MQSFSLFPYAVIMKSLHQQITKRYFYKETYFHQLT